MITSKIPVTIITLSLLHAWISIEAQMENDRIKNFQYNERMILEVIDIIRNILYKLPDPKSSREQIEMEVVMDRMKCELYTNDFDKVNIPKEELSIMQKITSESICVISNIFLEKIHPDYASNALFLSWVRLSTIINFVPENIIIK